MKAIGYALAAVIWTGLLMSWIPAQWAVSTLECGVFLVGIVWLVTRTFRREPILLPRAAWLLAAAVVWPMLQIAAGTTIYRWQTELWTLYWLMNLAVFIIASDCFRGALERRRMIQFTGVAGVILAMQGTLQLFTSEGNVFWLFPSGYKDLVVGPFIYKNQYAAFVELIIPIPFIWAAENRSWRILGMLFTGFLYASVIAAASRAGAILVTIELVILALLCLRGNLLPRRSAMLMIAALLLCCVAFIGALGPELLWKRFREEELVFGRREMNQSSLAMFRDRPWMGFGAGNWSTAYPAYAVYDDGTFANQAHSDWLEWTVEGGIPFVLLFVALAVWAVPLAIRSLWAIGVVAFLLHGFADYPTRRPALAAFFFFLLGLLAASARDRGMRGELYYGTASKSLLVRRNSKA